ncbi:MAG: hypothetical protein CL424_13905 [Acidimicrobiaceae bacterium]|nr:hypothetical protein [Acidimicrobiaceae bacterium]
MRQRVLITGASGLLGTWLLRTAPPVHDIVAASHRTPLAGVETSRVDLRDEAAVRVAVSRIEPTVIVHAAYDKNPESIVTATKHVVDAAVDVGAAVVHVSSDTVFSGDGRRRDESSPIDASSDYGRWKAAAEQPVLDSGGAVVRASLLVSVDPDDHGLRRLRAGRSDRSPSIWFCDEFRQPAWTSEVAEALWRLVDLSGDDRAGCWHLPGPERMSRLELATRLADRAGLPASAVAAGHRPPDTDRPADIVLGDARARRVIGWRPSPI